MTGVLDRYVAVLATVLMGTSVLFAWAGETRLGLCTTIYIVEVLALNQIAVYVSSAARKRLHAVDRVLILCFAIIAAIELVRILTAAS